MSVKNRKNILLLPICICVALIMTGGFFDYSVAVTGAFITICLFFMLIKGETFFGRDKRIVFLIPAILMCISILVSFWAVDYMDNFMGVMRLGVICLWMYLIRCRKREEVFFTQQMIPLLGCVNIGISLLSLSVPKLTPYFWENSRMSGFFQYANTNGLLFAIGIMILIYHIREQKKIVFAIAQIVLLLIGLLLSGSRSVLLLLLLWGVWYAVKTREFRKPFLLGAASTFLVGGIYVAATGNTANIGRIFTIFTSNSTLWGRLLYYRDAILMIAKNLFGMGRLGYYYSQGMFQSGVYRIKFVHNDFLQMALDYGVIAFFLLLVFGTWQIFCGKQSRVEKELVVFIAASSLFDFHCQYLFIVMMACLFLDYGDCVKEKRAQIKENYILLPICMVLFIYVGIATGSSKMGNQDIALSMLPDYTYAQEKMMLSNMGTELSYELSSRLIQKNPYNLTAYVTRGSFYASGLYVRECIADLDKMLELDPYNVEYYAQYELILKNMKAQLEMIAVTSENQSVAEELELLQSRIDSLPAQLSAMQDRTSSIAYKIKDLPVFDYE